MHRALVCRTIANLRTIAKLLRNRYCNNQTNHCHRATPQIPATLFGPFHHRKTVICTRMVLMHHHLPFIGSKTANDIKHFLRLFSARLHAIGAHKKVMGATEVRRPQSRIRSKWLKNNNKNLNPISFPVFGTVFALFHTDVFFRIESCQAKSPPYKVPPPFFHGAVVSPKDERPEKCFWWAPVPAMRIC